MSMVCLGGSGLVCSVKDVSIMEYKGQCWLGTISSYWFRGYAMTDGMGLGVRGEGWVVRVEG